jgi:hypothetical protein
MEHRSEVDEFKARNIEEALTLETILLLGESALQK